MMRLIAVLVLVLVLALCSSWSCTAGLDSVGFVSVSDTGQTGGSGSGGAGSTNPDLLIPPNLNTMQVSITAANAFGIVVGLGFNGVTFPACTKGDGSALDFEVTYSVSDLPSWLSFDAATRQIALNGTARVPAGATTTSQVTYRCAAVNDASLSAFRTFTINDADADSIADTYEYRFGAVPRVGQQGYLQLNPGNSALYPSVTTAIVVTSSVLSATTAGDASQDFDGDGATNAQEIAAGTNIFVKGSNGNLTRQGNDFSTTRSASFLTAADFNGDGRLDVAVANDEITTDCVSLRLGNGDGTFGGETRTCINGSLRGIVAVDVDRDGDLDLAVADLWNSVVSILLNAGDGTFPTEAEYAAGTEPYAITAGDFNKDGFIDLATANLSTIDPTDNSMSIFLNNGNGTFASQVRYAAGPNPYGITAADFDGDGDLDVAVSNNGGTTAEDLSVFLNVGNGTFGSPTETDLGGVTPRHVTAADYDNDGDYDLAISSFDGQLFVMLGNGDGTFAAATSYAAGNGGEGLSSLDIDGDGDVDIVVADANDDALSVFKNNGNGTFQNRTTVATGDNPFGIIPADFDRDGDIDLAVINFNESDFSVYLNN